MVQTREIKAHSLVSNCSISATTRVGYGPLVTLDGCSKLHDLALDDSGWQSGSNGNFAMILYGLYSEAKTFVGGFFFIFFFIFENSVSFGVS